MQAAQTVGLPFIEDLNLPSSPTIGCAKAQWTIDEHSRRSSTFHAFLPSVLAQKRKNLHICTGTLVEKVNTERLPDGSVEARGITLIVGAGEKRKSVSTSREIILCAGPFNSVQILMLR